MSTKSEFICDAAISLRAHTVTDPDAAVKAAEELYMALERGCYIEDDEEEHEPCEEAGCEDCNSEGGAA